MMLLLVTRRWLSDKSTIGELFVDGEFECYTLEDVVRSGPKVPGKTAIPAGVYGVVIDFSHRFQRMMPHIMNVPDFDGVRIHWGNKAADTEGCILVGRSKGVDFIGESRVAFGKLFEKLKAAIGRGELVQVSVQNA
jgi:hypothetical protein